MKRVIYRLADGTVVTTLAEAKASQQRYTIDYEPFDLDAERKAQAEKRNIEHR